MEVHLDFGLVNAHIGGHACLGRDETLFPGHSFDLDFHSVPYHGEHPVVERHYVSSRSRRQPSVLVFLAHDADGRAFCYANADLRKGEEAEELFRFIAFWKRRHCVRLLGFLISMCAHFHIQHLVSTRERLYNP